MDETTAALHPSHPGVGSLTSLIAAKSTDGDAGVGGFFVFLPSGRTKVITWRQMQPITPTLDAAKQYAAKVIESLQRDGLHDDIDRTNWVSVTAAIERIILDWNLGRTCMLAAARMRLLPPGVLAVRHLKLVWSAPHHVLRPS